MTNRSRLSSDTAIGLLFVGMLALGVVMVSRSSTFSGDIVGILFGEILGASPADLLQQAVALAVVAGIAGVFARPFLLLCFDPEQADMAGWPSRRYHAVLLTMITVTVVMSFQTVGTLLVFGMLLAPAGTGALLAHRLPAMIGWAAGVGSVSVYLGLLLSYHYDLAGSAAVVLVAVTVFFVVFSAQTVRQRFAAAGAERGTDGDRPPASPSVQGVTA